jgi:hypothetical protein
MNIFDFGSAILYQSAYGATFLLHKKIATVRVKKSFLPKKIH